VGERAVFDILDWDISLLDVGSFWGFDGFSMPDDPSDGIKKTMLRANVELRTSSTPWSGIIVSRLED